MLTLRSITSASIAAIALTVAAVALRDLHTASPGGMGGMALAIAYGAQAMVAGVWLCRWVYLRLRPTARQPAGKR